MSGKLPWWAVVGLVTVMSPTGALAQRAGSRLIEPDHWAGEYLVRLRRAGYLGRLDPLAQPYRWDDVARGLASLDPNTLPDPYAFWVRLLRSEFPSDSAELRAGVVVLGDARAANTRRLDGLRPADSGAVWPSGEAGVWVRSGPLAAETRVLWDTYLKRDPDGRAPHLRLGGISNHTYLSLTSGRLGVALGRFTRNWAPPGVQGFLVSDNPLSYPQVGFEFDFGRVLVQAFTGELDTLGATRRYLVAHRVSYTAPRFAVALSEGMLYGSNAGLSLQRLNPFTPLLFEHENPPGEEVTENLMLGVQFWHRLGDVEVQGEGLLDDISVNRDSATNGRAPARYALRLAGRWRPVGPRAEVNLAYERVSSYAYRSFRLQDRYDYLRRGLGANFADYDRVALSVDVFPPVPGLRLSPTLQYQRQGEGDYRTPFPETPTFVLGPDFLLGVPERTLRVSLEGRYQPLRQAWVEWDIGQNFVRNARHLTGESRSRLVALGTLHLRLDLLPLSRAADPR
jgi:hypothetical protein